MSGLLSSVKSTAPRVDCMLPIDPETTIATRKVQLVPVHGYHP